MDVPSDLGHGKTIGMLIILKMPPCDKCGDYVISVTVEKYFLSLFRLKKNSPPPKKKVTSAKKKLHHGNWNYITPTKARGSAPEEEMPQKKMK